MKFPLIVSTWIILVLAFLLQSCSNGNAIIKSPSITLNGTQNIEKLDSIRITKVVDQRNLKNSRIVGKERRLNDADDERKIVLKEPLEKMLQSTLNGLICKDTTEKGYIPVILTVSAFELSNNGSKSYFNFNYLFEFPNDKGGTHSLKIGKHLESNSFSGANEIDSLLEKGMISTGKLFVDKYKQYKSGKPDTIGQSELSYFERPEAKKSKKDRKEEKSGIGINFAGDSEFSLICVEFLHFNHYSNLELGWGCGVQLGKIGRSQYSPRNFNTGSDIFFCGSGSINLRYSLLENFNGPFIGGSGSVGAGVQINDDTGKDDFGFCGVLEGYIGVYLIKQVSISAGLSQIIGSNSNSATCISLRLSITGAYKRVM